VPPTKSRLIGRQALNESSKTKNRPRQTTPSVDEDLETPAGNTEFDSEQDSHANIDGDFGGIDRPMVSPNFC
jgi:hypothetical protein